MADAASLRICERFPLHWAVWNNDFEGLLRELGTKQHDIERLDPRGRTPLHLAVTLGHAECARTLLRHDANANAENAGYWSVLQEAVSSGDPETVQAVLQHRDYQRFMTKTEGVPALLERLKESPDFYVEMKWEFTSWVPLVSRLCPNDTYKVWKSGSTVRIDTTLLGFDNRSWKRGNRSYFFIGLGDSAKILEVDHEGGLVYREDIQALTRPPSIDLVRPSEDDIVQRLLQPVVTSYLDTDNIAFERNKSGVWGWRTDKKETVGNYECKVFTAANVQFVTKTRTEHLTDKDKKQKKWTESLSPLENFLGLAQQQSTSKPAEDSAIANMHNPCSIKPEDYFNPLTSLEGRDIGRPVEQTTKTQKFKAALSLCEGYPLTLQEQVLPIIDLMATSNAHFKRLKDFITLQLPAGFPMKIEIPLFHVLNAKITFGNLFAEESPVSQVHCLTSSPLRPLSSVPNEDVTDGGHADPSEPEPPQYTCTIDDDAFVPPPTYRVIGEFQRREAPMDEEDQLLQFTLQQSLMSSGASDNGAPPGSDRLAQPGITSPEEAMLQRAIAESLGQPVPPVDQSGAEETPPAGSNTQDLDYEQRLQLAIARSEESVSQPTAAQREREEQERREAEELERVLALSLTEK